MSNLNETPTAQRMHIALLGRTNSGKSSIINAITGQNLSIVSDVAGTTTDPVYKAMELLPLGPVVLIDTPGLSDTSTLGQLRMEKTREVLAKTDIALLAIDATKGIDETEKELVRELKKRKIPFVVAVNKSDAADLCDAEKLLDTDVFFISAKTGEGIYELKEQLAIMKPAHPDKRLIGDIIKAGDFIILVTPIDAAAPKGRLILPQQQVLRDVLDTGAIAIVAKETEYEYTLKKLGIKPRLVITDSQVFEYVSKLTPAEVPLTSFSIIFARYKVDLPSLKKGAYTLDTLADGDSVLICEGCTHHRQCDDIGTIKIPKWISKYTGKQLNFEFTSGGTYPKDLSKYALVVHCGACMLNEREMQNRVDAANMSGIPIVNYGVIIAYMNGILDRVIKPFVEKE